MELPYQEGNQTDIGLYMLISFIAVSARQSTADVNRTFKRNTSSAIHEEINIHQYLGCGHLESTRINFAGTQVTLESCTAWKLTALSWIGRCRRPIFHLNRRVKIRAVRAQCPSPC